MTLDGLFAVGLSGLIFLAWAYHLKRTTERWLDERTAEEFSHFLIALMVWLGALAFLTGAIALYWLPDLTNGSRFLGFLVRGALIVVGAYVVITWRRDRGV